MLFDTPVFVGVDPSGGRKPFTYAALDAQTCLLTLAEGEMEDVLAYLGGQQAALVAVCAPQRPNSGLVRETRQSLPLLHQSGRVQEMRLAEHGLRERGINVSATPARREYCAAWVQAGFDFYRQLADLGYQPYSNEKPARAFLETHPQACFTVLLGQLPFSRASLEGRLQRQLILYEQGLRIRDPMDFFEELTRHKLLKGHLPLELLYAPEQLDALAAAYTAWLAGNKPFETSVLGDPQEGQITLPARELKPNY
ncbi:MAG: DUF429 domain-containing protein [Anaerolineales bacterium]|jgi:hypothetical protein|nr:DUF429 domain-containing protein [Anaerolineales bacterium]